MKYIPSINRTAVVLTPKSSLFTLLAENGSKITKENYCCKKNVYLIGEVDGDYEFDLEFAKHKMDILKDLLNIHLSEVELLKLDESMLGQLFDVEWHIMVSDLVSDKLTRE